MNNNIKTKKKRYCTKCLKVVETYVKNTSSMYYAYKLHCNECGTFQHLVDVDSTRAIELGSKIRFFYGKTQPTWNQIYFDIFRLTLLFIFCFIGLVY